MPSPPSQEDEDDDDGAALPALAEDTPIPSRADFIPNQLPGPSLEDVFVDLVELALDPSLEGVGLMTIPSPPPAAAAAFASAALNSGASSVRWCCRIAGRLAGDPGVGVGADLELFDGDGGAAPVIKLLFGGGVNPASFSISSSTSDVLCLDFLPLPPAALLSPSPSPSSPLSPSPAWWWLLWLPNTDGSSDLSLPCAALDLACTSEKSIRTATLFPSKSCWPMDLPVPLSPAALEPACLMTPLRTRGSSSMSPKV